MDNLAREDSVFKEVQSAEKSYWSAPENRYLQLQEEIADLDYRTGLLDAEQRGEKRGEKRGEIRGEMRNKLQTARKLLTRGLSIRDICDITGLPENDIRTLKSL